MHKMGAYKAVCLGLVGILLWWGLSAEPVGSTETGEGVVIRFWQWEAACLDRDFFLARDGEGAFVAWSLSLALALGAGAWIYALCAGLFPLGRLSLRARFLFFGLLAGLVLLTFNPLLALFLNKLPGNFQVFALSLGRGFSALAALIAGLSLAGIVHALLPGTAVSITESLCALVCRPLFLVTAGLGLCALLLWVRLVPLEGMATVSDELSYLRQGEIFLSGQLSEPTAEPAAFFDAEQMVNDGRYYSKYPPGTALCFLPALALGLPQAGPVFFLAMNLLMTFLLARRLFGRITALLSLLLAGISPFFLAMGESFLSHGPGLLATLCMAYFHVRWLQDKKEGFALLSGAFGGLCLLIRPVSAAVLVLAFLVHGQILFQGSLRKRGFSLLVFVGSLGAFALLMLWYNQSLTGDPFFFPYERYAELYAPYDRFGTENAGQGLLNTAFNLSRLNQWLFGFVPSLLPAAALFLLGAAASWEILFACAFLGLAGAYLFHWFWGTPWYGPLYYYESAAFLIILSARGLMVLQERFRSLSEKAGMHGTAAASLLYLAVVCVALFSAPSFMVNQVKMAGERIQALWKPVLEAGSLDAGSLGTDSLGVDSLDTAPLEPGAWLLLDGTPGRKPGYLGASPEWMSRGIRILNGEGGPPEELKALYPDKRIFFYDSRTGSSRPILPGK